MHAFRATPVQFRRNGTAPRSCTRHSFGLTKEKRDMKPTLRLKTWLGLAVACLGFHASGQVAQRTLESAGMPISVLYPTAELVKPVRSGPFELHLAPPNAKPLPGRRQLIVLSHGTAGSPEPDFALASSLVRAGFVVAQPLHRGDNFRDFSQAGPASWRTRPTEVSEVIDAVARDAVLTAVVDTQRVGVHGMSAGGVSGLALAGAQWRMVDLIRHCAQSLDEDVGFCLNGLAGQPQEQQERRAQFTSSRGVPETYLPAELLQVHGGRANSTDPRPDPRVAAVSLLVPVAAIFTPESLARIRIPVGVTLGGRDEVLWPEYHGLYLLKHCPTCKLLSSPPLAGHLDWLWPWPAELAQAIAPTQIRGGWPNESFTPAMRQTSFDGIVSFFQTALRR